MERDLRRVVVAEHLCNLPKFETKPLVIYPPKHVNEIIEYIYNPEKRAKRLKIYSALLRRSGLEENLKARNYRYSGGKWNKA